MATCNECLHIDACSGFLPSDLDKDVWDLCREWRADEIPDIEERCSSFKDRSRFVELPCKLGDPVYIIVNLKNGNPSHIVERRCTGIHITEKVFKHRAEKAHRYLATNSDIGFAQHIPFTEFGRTVFFTREKAEKALAERSKE